MSVDVIGKGQMLGHGAAIVTAVVLRWDDLGERPQHG